MAVVKKRKTPAKKKARGKLHADVLVPSRKGGATRPFAKGNPGRPKGSKDKVPRGLKASVRAVCEKIASSNVSDIERAILNGIRNGGARNSIMYLRMVAEYVDGKPRETIDVNADVKLQEMLANAKDSLSGKLASLAASRRADEVSS